MAEDCGYDHRPQWLATTREGNGDFTSTTRRLTGEGKEGGHEVLGHMWGEMFGGHPAMVNGHASRANMRDSIIGENAVRALDPTRGQKGLESHHNYNDRDTVP